MSIIEEYGIDKQILLRDYSKNPLKSGCNQYTNKAETPYKDDLVYLYIKLNIPRIKLCEYFNCGATKFKKWLKYFNIKKPSIYGKFNKCKIPLETLNLLMNKNLLEKFIKDNNIKTYIELAHLLNISPNHASKYIKKYKLESYFNKHKSYQEKELQQFVSTLFNIECNNRSILKPYELDIYIPSLNIGIEYMGKHWHDYGLFPDKFNSDIKKNIKAYNKGIKIIYIWEDYWMKYREYIKNKLFFDLCNK